MTAVAFPAANAISVRLALPLTHGPRSSRSSNPGAPPTRGQRPSPRTMCASSSGSRAAPPPLHPFLSQRFDSMVDVPMPRRHRYHSHAIVAISCIQSVGRVAADRGQRPVGSPTETYATFGALHLGASLKPTGLASRGTPRKPSMMVLPNAHLDGSDRCWNVGCVAQISMSSKRPALDSSAKPAAVIVQTSQCRDNHA